MQKRYKGFIFFICVMILNFNPANGENTLIEKKDKMNLIYVYDALCGWCYGFSPVITKIHQKYKADFSFEVISGGMVTGDRVGPIGEVAPYISNAYKAVEDAAGVEFGKAFLVDILEEGSTRFSSFEPALAMTVFKEKFPEKAVEFSARLNKAIYYDGVQPADLESYIPIAAELGYRERSFRRALEDEEYKTKTYLDFQKSGSLEVRGFPTVFLEINGERHRVSVGYVSYEELEQRIQKILTEK
ncbi:MAG: DsbA family protein [Chitinophagaceae bacterium]|nr:MAG: DsbA family protein [Chitinophagaceae bacterium]